MNILIVGASGSIGGEALTQCLAHPEISKVVAFGRRKLAISHPKLNSVIIEDFSAWPKDVLREHADSAGMIWAMGSYKGSVTVDLEYGLAFMEAMGEVLKANPPPKPFRYVQLSGMFVRQDQDAKLWFLSYPRKLKGRLDKRALEFAQENPSWWKTSVVMPGAVITKDMFLRGALKTVLGDRLAVLNEELGAFMTHLAADGDGEEPITQNARIASKGRERLQNRFT